MPEFLALEDAEGLLDYLRSAGFTVDVDQHLRVKCLLSHIGGSRRRKELKTLIAPIVATSDAEQAKLWDAIDAYFDGHLYAVPLPGPPSPPGPPGPPDPPLPPRPLDLKYRRALGVILVLAALVVAWQYISDRKTKAPVGRGAVLDTTPSDTGKFRDSTGVPPTPVPAPPGRGGERSSGTEDSAAAPVLAIPAQYIASRCIMPPLRLWESRRAMALLLLLPLLGLGLAEWRQQRRLRAAYRQRRKAGPPYEPHVEVKPPPDVRPYRSAPFYVASRAVRRRQRSDATRFAVEPTIAATIDAGGFPVFKFDRTTRVPEYLFLIEQQAPRDHQAALFHALVESLRSDGIETVTCTYEHDPRLSHRDDDGALVPLAELQRRYSDSRLIILGSGELFVHPRTGVPESWMKMLEEWQQPAILTPRTLRRWGRLEIELGKHLVVLPATLAGLRALADYYDDSRTAVVDQAWTDRLGPTQGTIPGTNASLEQLRAYLGEPAFGWLCACAVYPQVQWDLTLRLGLLPDVGKDLLTEENLLRLVRLPWFRTGFMPHELRLSLVQCLTPAAQRATRSLIAEVLRDNPAPASSGAEERQLALLATQKLYLADDAKARQEALDQLAEVVPGELRRDPVGLRALRQAGGWRHSRSAASRTLVRAAAAAGLTGGIWLGCARTPRATIDLLSVGNVRTADVASDSMALARLAGLRRDVAKDHRVLFFASGSVLSPSLSSKFYGGLQMVQLLDAAGLDYATFGEGDFAMPRDTLLSRIAASSFTWVSSNCTASDGSPFPNVRPWDTLTIDGVRIGVLGLTGPGDYRSYVRCTNPDSAAASAVEQLAQAGASVIVALTSQPFQADSLLLARQKRIDVLLGGDQWAPEEASVGDRCLLKADRGARAVQRVTLRRFRTTGVGAQLVSLDNQAPDPAALGVASRWRDSLSERLGPERQVTVTTEPLDARDTVLQAGESALGDLVADAARAGSGADVALIPASVFRLDDVIGAGAISNYDFESLFLFADETRVVRFELPGARLREVLEYGVAGERATGRRFFQVSGIQFDYVPTRPAGKRVPAPLRLPNGRPLGDGTPVSVAMDRYNACQGGDGVSVPEVGQACAGSDSSPRLVDLVLQHVAGMGGRLRLPSGGRAVAITADSADKLERATVRVPDVVGVRLDSARRRIEAAGLRIAGDSVAQPSLASRLVRQQNPIAGTPVPPGTDVTVVITRPIVLVRVPSVIGRSERDASARLRSVGLVPRPDSVASDSLLGSVVGQDPPPGRTVRPATEVRILVGRRAAPRATVTPVVPVVVPNLVGLRGDSATTALTAVGLLARVDSSAGVTLGPEHPVERQTPAPGFRVPRGSTVRLEVSAQDPMIQIGPPPDTLVGYDTSSVTQGPYPMAPDSMAPDTETAQQAPGISPEGPSYGGPRPFAERFLAHLDAWWTSMVLKNSKAGVPSTELPQSESLKRVATDSLYPRLSVIRDVLTSDTATALLSTSESFVGALYELVACREATANELRAGVRQLGNDKRPDISKRRRLIESVYSRLPVSVKRECGGASR